MLAIGTSDGIVMLESKNAAWEVAERALPGARVEGVCSTGSGTIVATDQGIFESSDSTGGWRKTLDGVDARSLAVTTDGIVFVGANNAMLYRRRPSEEHFTEVTSFRELPTCASWTFPVSPASAEHPRHGGVADGARSCVRWSGGRRDHADGGRRRDVA